MKYYCIKQHDITDCGAACLATISKQYGLNLSISKIREVAGIDKQGTNAYGMIKAAEQLKVFYEAGKAYGKYYTWAMNGGVYDLFH